MLALVILYPLLVNSVLAVDETVHSEPESPAINMEPPHFNEETFLENIKLRPHFVDFYAPW